MRNLSFSAMVLAGAFALGAPAWAQEATEAPAVVIVAPEGYMVTEITSVTADELKGVNIYDAEGNDVAEIADLVIGADNAVTGVITDVGGFIGIGEHRISLSPDQVHIYKNADNEIRAFVTLTKDEMKALPAYVAP